MKQAFASDFDNTLCFQDGIHSQDILAVEKKQKEGLLFGVCTGRSYQGVLGRTEGRIDFDFYILSTGSLILNKEGKEIYSKTIDKETTLSITSFYGKDYSINYNSGYDFYSLTPFFEIVKVIPDLNHLPKEIHGISFLSSSTEKAMEICSYINKHYPVSSYNNGPFVDVTAKDCSKGNAIHFLKSYYHLDKIYGMGDSYNDLPLLEAVDTSFTFPNSPEEVKAKADFIKPSLAEALESIH